MCIKYTTGLCLLSFFLLRCGNPPPADDSQLSIGALGDQPGEIRIKSWKLSGSVNRDSSFRYEVKDDHIDLDSVFPGSFSADYHAACTINSGIDQDAAFLMGASGKIKVWVNDSLCLKETKSRTERNDIILPVHLHKGRNSVALKVCFEAKKRSFYFNISSIKYAGNLYTLYNSSNFLDNPLPQQARPLSLSFNDILVPPGDSMSITILDQQGNIQFREGRKRMGTLSFSLPQQLKPGPYVCRLRTGGLLLEQNFIYGDHEGIFRAISGAIGPYCRNEGDRINIETMLLRYRHLDSTGRKDGFDQALGRKIAILLSDLEGCFLRLKEGKEAFAHISGLHIRGYRSGIDGSIDHYMLYVPDSYKKTAPLPLVIVMPFITNPLPFIKSWRVADINGIEMTNHLADKYGVAVLTVGSRISDRYNLNPITEAATFDVIANVCKDYNIDSNRLYLYGSCAGGLLALLLANRHPSVFAAVGAKGPELGYTNNRDPSTPYPPEWLADNNILRSAANYSNTGIYIIHSVKDEKADYAIAHALVDSIHRTGGPAMLETLADVSKTQDFDLYPTAEITDKMFRWFKSQALTLPSTINFSTPSLQYNKAFWITIDQIDSCQKASVAATLTGKDHINIVTRNVHKITIDLPRLPIAGRADSLTILIDGQLYYTQKDKEKDTLLQKTPQLCGPINHLFSSGFLLVEGTLGTPQEVSANHLSAQRFIANWEDMYQVPCRVKRDLDITRSDISSYHLILIGAPATNALLKKMIGRLPFTISENAVVIRGKTIKGNDLEYSILYPNPLNPSRYILLLGSNDPVQSITASDLPYNGWSDYVIHNPGDLIKETGIFNSYWR